MTPHPREAYTALKLVCWINTLERRLFSAPYESKDCDAKMTWFLPRWGEEGCWAGQGGGVVFVGLG